MAAIIPISCKSGVVIFAGADVYGEQWGMSLRIENDDYKHYEMTPDANNVIWKQVLTSFAGGDGSCRVKFDNTPGARLMPDKDVWLDTTGIAWMGYTATVGFIISYTMIGLDPSQDTANPHSSLYNPSFKVTACVFSITGP